MTPALRIHRTIAIDAVPWSRLRETLATRQRLAIGEADRLAADLRERAARIWSFHSPYNQQLSPRENGAVRSLVELVGADEITVSASRDLTSGPLRVRLTRQTHLRPGLRQDALGCAESCLLLECAGHTLRARQRIAVYLLLAAVFALVTLTYAVLLGLVLYAFSVFYVFLQMPADVAAAATRKLPVGLALLAMLVGLAGLTGRAVSNIVGLIRARRQARVSARSTPNCEDERPAVVGEE